jgi:hypothetical protein
MSARYAEPESSTAWSLGKAVSGSWAGEATGARTMSARARGIGEAILRTIRNIVIPF